MQSMFNICIFNRCIIIFLNTKDEKNYSQKQKILKNYIFKQCMHMVPTVKSNVFAFFEISCRKFGVRTRCNSFVTTFSRFFLEVKLDKSHGLLSIMRLEFYPFSSWCFTLLYFSNIVVKSFVLYKNYITVDNIVCFNSKVLYDMSKYFFQIQ